MMRVSTAERPTMTPMSMRKFVRRNPLSFRKSSASKLDLARKKRKNLPFFPPMK
jgi:hypothetical protein